jgi:hypothetical protein
MNTSRTQRSEKSAVFSRCVKPLRIVRRQVYSCSNFNNFYKIIEYFFTNYYCVRFIGIDFLYPMHHGICEYCAPLLREEVRFSHFPSKISFLSSRIGSRAL